MKRIGKLSSLFLYSLLALGLSMAVMAAAAGYAAAQDGASRGQAVRLAAQLVRTKIRQSGGDAAIGPDGTILVREEYPEGAFYSALYVHEGWLCEQLVPEGAELYLPAGDRLVRCAGMRAEMRDGGLAYRIATDAGDAQGFIALPERGPGT